VLGQPIEREYSLLDLLRRPNVSYRSLMELPLSGEGLEDPIAAEQVEIQAKYQGYIERQNEDVKRRASFE
jgi:tRNA uridine 5-carboxymethylaminomethyl modification enzyme